MLKTCFEKTCFKNQTCFEKRSFEKTCILREQIHGQSILKSNTHALALQWEFHEKREKWKIEKVQCPGFERETMWLTARRATDSAIWDFVCYEPTNMSNELPRSRVIIRIWTSTRPENTHPCTCEHGTRWPTGVRPLGAKKGKVSDYLQTARNHLAPTKSKAEVDTITNNLLDGIDVDEYAEDSDF